MKKETYKKLEEIFSSRNPEQASGFFELDFSDFSDEEWHAIAIKLFEEDWHYLHENLALWFQSTRNPMSIDILYKNAFREELDLMDYKPLARKCTWALADIGTEKAKMYLEKMAKCGDELIEGFAKKRLNNWEAEQTRKGRLIYSKTKFKNSIKLDAVTSVIEKLPKSGKHITGYQVDDYIIVYQAYKPSIAAWAQENQKLGGFDFSFERMSWIKPNFLWMMYRSGWATKENQERILAIAIPKDYFIYMLSQSALTSFNPEIHTNEEKWKQSLEKTDIRIQWDPEHGLKGEKLESKAIQIGIKGKWLKEFAQKQILFIEDITNFVNKQRIYLQNGELDKMHMPNETILIIDDEKIRKRIGLNINDVEIKNATE